LVFILGRRHVSAYLSGHLQVIKYVSLEEAIQRKLCNQMYGTNFQRDLVGVHLTNSMTRRWPDK